MSIIKGLLIGIGLTLTASEAMAAPLHARLLRALESAGLQKTVRVLVRMKVEDARPSGIRVPALSPASRTGLLTHLRQRADSGRQRLLAELSRCGPGGCGPRPRSLWLVDGMALSLPASAVKSLASNPTVASVTLLERVPVPRAFPSRTPTNESSHTWGLTALGVPQIRALYKLTGRGVRIGHLDTGLAGDHPELAGKVERWKDFTSQARPTPTDEDGHGTHSAATLVGGNGPGRWIGVAPDSRLIAGRIFTSEGGDPEAILEAMQWVVDPDGDPATDDGATVVNNSWGSDDPENRVFWDAVSRWVQLGVLPCFAAGNNGPGKVGVPAGYPHALAVGSVRRDMTSAEFSSVGPVTWDGQTLTKPDLVAPGTEILSASPRGNGYAAMEGTSMSAPHVTGLLALMRQVRPDLTIEQALEILRSTARDLGPAGPDNTYGHGFVDGLRAVGRAAGSPELEGRVTGPGGHSIPGATLRFPRLDLTLPLDAQGRWITSLPAGRYEFEVTAPGHGRRTATIDVKAGSTARADLELSPAAATTLTGTVTASDEPRALAATITVLGSPAHSVQADPMTGRFSIEVTGGTHRLLVTAPGRSPHYLPAVDAGSPALQVKLAPRRDVLLVDDDEADKLEEYYAKPLATLGRSVTVWDTRELGAVPAAVLMAHPLVVWQTGADYQTALTSEEQEALQAYLESGGHLYLAGQTAMAGIRTTPLFTKFLQARWIGLIKREPGRPVPSITGVPADPIGHDLKLVLNGADSQDNQQYPALIGAASVQASPILTYTSGVGPAAYRVDTGTFRFVHTAFGLEGVKGVAARQLLLERILDWLKPSAVSTVGRLASAASIPGTRRALPPSDEDLIEDARAALSSDPDPEARLAGLVAATSGIPAAALRTLRRSLRAPTGR